MNDSLLLPKCYDFKDLSSSSIPSQSILLFPHPSHLKVVLRRKRIEFNISKLFRQFSVTLSAI